MQANESYPCLAPSLLDRDLGDEYLVYDRDSGQIHVLNPTARKIIRLCDGTRSIEQIAECLAEFYAIDRERARADTAELLRELTHKGVVILTDRAERSA